MVAHDSAERRGLPPNCGQLQKLSDHDPSPGNVKETHASSHWGTAPVCAATGLGLRSQ